MGRHRENRGVIPVSNTPTASSSTPPSLAIRRRLAESHLQEAQDVRTGRRRFCVAAARGCMLVIAVHELGMADHLWAEMRLEKHVSLGWGWRQRLVHTEASPCRTQYCPVGVNEVNLYRVASLHHPRKHHMDASGSVKVCGCRRVGTGLSTTVRVQDRV